MARRWWSPDEIAQRLRHDFPDDPMMRVSHETIYKSLFVQGRGELRRELTRCLRSGRATRRSQAKVETGGQIPSKIMISERPAEIEDRAVPGHWEGDLIIGANNKSAVGTLVERSTRYVMLLRFPGGYSRRQGQQGNGQGHGDPAGRAGSERDLGPGHRDEPARQPSLWRPGSRSTSAIPTVPGNGGRTRTPTVFFANTCPRAPTFRSSAQRISLLSNGVSMVVPARPSGI